MTATTKNIITFDLDTYDEQHITEAMDTISKLVKEIESNSSTTSYAAHKNTLKATYRLLKMIRDDRQLSGDEQF